jgi:adenosylcobinamide hydrolase
MCETRVEAGVCRLRLSGGRWLATGHAGGYRRADRAVNVTVPSDFDRRDLASYVAERCDRAGFEACGPALLTAVDQAEARGATAGSVTVVATAGLSNPASLPQEDLAADASHDRTGDAAPGDQRPPFGTVNLMVATTRALADGGLAGCLATAVEAKTATLQALTGFTGTTTDGVAIGADPDGERAAYVGSSTDLGRDVRVAVRDALRASLAATYDGGDPPASVAAADHGAVTRRPATVFTP